MSLAYFFHIIYFYGTKHKTDKVTDDNIHTYYLYIEYHIEVTDAGLVKVKSLASSCI